MGFPGTFVRRFRAAQEHIWATTFITLLALLERATWKRLWLAEVYLHPFQTSKIDLFAKIVNHFLNMSDWSILVKTND